MNNNSKIGIVIVGYNNVKGTKRLLNSLQHSDYGDKNNIPLIFSIDYSGNNDVEQIAKAFEWTHGEKKIVARTERMGLKSHILSCGDFLESEKLDALVVLEDDIAVSPVFFDFAQAAVKRFSDDDRVAGISLYKHEINILAKRPFMELNDGGDNFFIQYAQSWGQVWLKKQWRLFREWLDSGRAELMDLTRVPKNLLGWENSWLKYHILYCIDCNLYFVYPRVSLTTNMSDPGAHRTSSTTWLQVPLLYQVKREWKFNSIDETSAVYDAFFENRKIISIFTDYTPLTVDLYGIKPYYERYLLTEKALQYKVLHSWGRLLRPHEANIICGTEGADIFLYDTTIVAKKPQKGAHSKKLEYDLKGTNILNKATISLVAVKVFGRFKKFIKRKKKKR